MVTKSNRLSEQVSFPKDKTEWYHFLEDNVDYAIRIREWVDSLPDTATTFKKKHVPEGKTRSDYITGMLKLCGAWQAPEFMFKNGATWVNPNATDSHHYSDAIVKCACGVPVLRHSFGEALPQPVHQQDHADGCDIINKTEARLELLKNRKRILKDQYYYNISPRQSAQRLGYTDPQSINYDGLYDLGVDMNAVERESRKRMARTCIVLARDYSFPTIAKVFGVGHDTIGRMVRKETTANSRTLYKARRVKP